jgi:hypothetical protein
MMSDTKSKFIRINSRYKVESAFPNRPSAFSYNFDPKAEGITNATAISMTRFQMLRTFSNIYKPFNTIKTKITGEEEKTYTLPSGQYNATELVTMLNETVPIGTFELSGDMIELTATQNIKLLKTSGLGWKIGLYNDLSCGAGVPTAMNSTPDLSGPCNIYVEASFCTANVYDSLTDTGGTIPLIDTVACHNVPFGFNISKDVTDIQSNLIEYSSGIDLQNCIIRILDRYGNELHMPENCYCDIVIKYWYDDTN